MATPKCPVLSGLGGLALPACPDMSCIVSSLEALLYFGSGGYFMGAGNFRCSEGGLGVIPLE